MAIDFSVKDQLPYSQIFDAAVNQRTKSAQLTALQNQQRQAALDQITQTISAASETVSKMVQKSRVNQLAALLSQGNQQVPAPGALPPGVQGPQPQVTQIPLNQTPDYNSRLQSAITKVDPTAVSSAIATQQFPNPAFSGRNEEIKPIVGPDGKIVYARIGKSPGMGAPAIIPSAEVPPTTYGVPNPAGGSDIINRASGKTVNSTGGIDPNTKDDQGNKIRLPYRNVEERKDLIQRQKEFTKETEPMTSGLDSIQNYRRAVIANIPASQYDTQVFKVRTAGLNGRMAQSEIANETGDPSVVEKFLQRANTFFHGNRTEENKRQFLAEAANIEQALKTALTKRISGAKDEYLGIHPGNDDAAVQNAFSSRYKSYLSQSSEQGSPQQEVQNLLKQILNKK